MFPLFIAAFEKTLMYYDTQDLPVDWDHDELLGTDEDEDFNEEEVGIVLLWFPNLCCYHGRLVL